MKTILEKEQEAAYDKALVDVAIKAIEDYRIRVRLDPGPGYYRPITPERRANINTFYASTALTMYKGVLMRMERQAVHGTEQEKRIASLLKGAL